MPDSTFQLDLATYGPDRSAARRMGQAEAEAYCRRLARRHYENFTVASWLLPRDLRQHFVNVYAFCRWADDLADEIAGAEQCLALLDWWQASLKRCYDGQAEHPVFIALAETIRQFEIPPQPFNDLLTAFRRDQTQTRYETFAELLGYCRYSANPVGRLVLYLGRCHNPLTTPLADSICTGLQLANHWQDLARDAARGRIYLPQEDMDRFGITPEMLLEKQATLEVCRLVELEVERAAEYLNAGWPLLALLPRKLKVDIELFLRGGLATLEAIRRQEFDVLARRPVVSKWLKLKLLASSWLGVGRPVRERRR